MGTEGCKGNKARKHERQPNFDRTSATVGMLVNRTWFCRYPHSQYNVYDNRVIESISDTCGIKHKPTSVRNPQEKAILKREHQTIMEMLSTAEIIMA